MTTFTEMLKYETYKDSGVEWIGQIPIHWELKKLKFISFINKQSLPENTSRSLTFEYVDIGSVTLEKGIEKVEVFAFSDAPSRARRMANEGDTVVSTVRTYLKAIAYVDDISSKYIYSTGFAVITPKCSEFSKYLTSFIKSDAFTKQVDDVAKGMSYPAINSTDLSNLFIAEPPESEHMAIANFLDEKTAKIDEAIAIKQKQIELLKERKQIIIQQAVTQGLDSTVPMKDSGVEWIGQIPAHWEVRKFKFLANVRYGLGQPPKQLEDGLKIIRATNVERGKIVENGMMFVDPNDIPWDRNPTLKHGEIIVVRSGAYTGDSALVTEDYDGCIAGYDMVATPKTCRPRFLAYALLSHYVLYEQIYLMRMRSAQPHLNAEELNEVLIVLPPDCEQINISRYIDKVDKEVCSSLQIIRSQIEKLKEYKTTLINSAVTGKIKVV